MDAALRRLHGLTPMQRAAAVALAGLLTVLLVVFGLFSDATAGRAVT